MKSLYLLIVSIFIFSILSACGEQAQSKTPEEQKKINKEVDAERESQEDNAVSEEIDEETKEGSNVKDGFVLYDIPDLGIKLQYPEGWDVEGDKASKSVSYSFTAPEKDGEKMPPFLNIGVWKSEYENVNSFAEEKISYFTDKNGFKLFEDKKIKFNGLDAVYKKYKTRRSIRGWTDIHRIRIFFIYNDKPYDITFLAFGDLMDKYDDIGKEIIDSIELIDVEEGTSSTDSSNIDDKYIIENIKRGLSQQEVVNHLGEPTHEWESKGQIVWRYDFTKNDYEVGDGEFGTVDEKGLKSGQLTMQLFIVWEDQEIDSIYNYLKDGEYMIKSNGEVNKTY